MFEEIKIPAYTDLLVCDRPKSVRNRCVIEVFGSVFMSSRCFLDFSMAVGALVTGLSQVSSFFSCCFVTLPKFATVANYQSSWLVEKGVWGLNTSVAVRFRWEDFKISRECPGSYCFKTFRDSSRRFGLWWWLILFYMHIFSRFEHYIWVTYKENLILTNNS